MSIMYFFDDYLSNFNYVIYTLVSITIAIVVLIAKGMVFKKAEHQGWKILIPFYNRYIFYEIATGEGIMFLLSYVPIVSFIMRCYLSYKLSKAFGKDIGYTLGLIFFPQLFYCMLGFGSAEYIGCQ